MNASMLAERTVQSMTAQEKRLVLEGDLTVAVWAAERTATCPPAIAERVAELVLRLLTEAALAKTPA